MKKTVFLVLLALYFCIIGCTPFHESAQTETYTITEGVGISQQRTGIAIQGVTTVGNGFECTHDGVYFLCRTRNGCFLLYGDHEADTLVKLCGRPDCRHNDNQCNAYFEEASNVCYYDGYLYVVEGINGYAQLIRLNPDGTHRKVVTRTVDVEGRYGGYTAPVVWNGIFSIALIKLDDDGNEVADTYFYRLDGSMDKMEPTVMGLPYKNDGDAFISFSLSAEGRFIYYLWDPDSNARRYLTEEIGFGYYGAERAYYILDGIIYQYDYSQDTANMLYNTQLEGCKKLYCFPDCIIVGDYSPWEAGVLNDSLDRINYHVYDWSFEPLGTFCADYPRDSGFLDLFCGETANRIYLSAGFDYIPCYYIDKSDFGTGNITIHPLELPADIQSMFRGT